MNTNEFDIIYEGESDMSMDAQLIDDINKLEKQLKESQEREAELRIANSDMRILFKFRCECTPEFPLTKCSACYTLELHEEKFKKLYGGEE